VLGGLALMFTHPWLALAAVVLVSAMIAALVFWAWRRVSRRLLRRRPRPTPG
jgi:hypothetical protein